MSWFVLAFIIPIFVAWKDGSSYPFAFSLMGVGALMYFMNVFLIRHFILRRASITLLAETWDSTAGKGIVPRWVSVIGLVGTGFVPGGAVVAILLYAGLIANRG